MARLPTVGGDYGNWGTVLNEYLATAHNADGTIDASRITETADAKIMTAAERTTVGSFRNIMTFAGVADAVTAGTDATDAVEAAIDACAPLGIPLFFPPGTYRIKNATLKTGAIIVGCGAATVFKLLDNSANWSMVFTTQTSTAATNVILRDFCIDGNASQIGAIFNAQMHGIAIEGGHEGWLIDNLLIKDCVGDGIWITSASSGTLIPKGIRIRGVRTVNCGRMDIAVINVDGAVISDCMGTGVFDVEANGDTSTCKNIAISNIHYDKINISTLGATSGQTQNDAVVAVGLNAVSEVNIWGVGGAAISSVVCPGRVYVTECYRVMVSDVVAGTLKVSAVSSRQCRQCSFAGVILYGGDADTLQIENFMDCKFSNFVIHAAGNDAIKISQGETPGAHELVLSNFDIRSHTRFGIYVLVSSAIADMTLILENVTIHEAGTNPLAFTSGGSTPYGAITVRDCTFYGRTDFDLAKVIRVDGLTVRGNATLDLGRGAGKSIDIRGIIFRRDSAGTPNIELSSTATDIAELRIGAVEQEPTGGFAMVLNSSTLAVGVKAWINGPVSESATVFDGFGANVHAGSSFRLRGNATNWGYTHNGTSWVAKAH